MGWGLGAPFTLLVSLSVLILFALTRSPGAVHRGARLWGRIVLKLCGIKVLVTGQEHLVPDVLPAIIIANHQSMLDIFALSGFLPIRFSWIAKNSLFRIPLLGSAMLRAGYIPIERTNRENAHRSIQIASHSLESHSVVIFPEGTRSRSGLIGPFKRGASFLAAQTGAPIVPVTITGSWQCLPPGCRRIAPGVIHIHVDAATATSSKSKEEIDRMIGLIRERMIERLSVFNGGNINPVTSGPD